MWVRLTELAPHPGVERGGYRGWARLARARREARTGLARPRQAVAPLHPVLPGPEVVVPAGRAGLGAAGVAGVLWVPASAPLHLNRESSVILLLSCSGYSVSAGV